MKFLITGVSGFVGEELSYFFQKNKNHSVLGIDKNEEYANNKIKFQKCDLVNDIDTLEKIFSEYKPDVVIHCAAKILLNYSDKDLVWKTNYYATKKLCELSEKNNVKKFIFFSTFSIFQKNYENPIDENETPTYKTAYGETKYEAEQMLLKMSFSGDICILRCPMILGKNRANRFGLLFDLIKDGYNLPLIGKCKNKLSFIHITDVALAIEKFLNCKGKHVFNIASNEFEEFQFILKRLINTANSKSKLVHFNKNIGNLLFDIVTFLRLVPYNSYHKKIFNFSIMLDTTKIKKTLNWEPTYTVERMFKETYLHSLKNKEFNPNSFSKSKPKEGLLKIIKKII